MAYVLAEINFVKVDDEGNEEVDSKGHIKTFVPKGRWKELEYLCEGRTDEDFKEVKIRNDYLFNKSRTEFDLWLELKLALTHLQTVLKHADEDCPSEYRTKWFNPSIKEGYEFLDKMVKKYGFIEKE